MSSGFEGAMYGLVLEADFELDTLTFEMEAGYAAAAGRFALVPADEYVRQSESRAELLEALRGLYDELERDHYGAGYAPEPDEPMGIAKAALATQRKEPGA